MCQKRYVVEFGKHIQTHLNKAEDETVSDKATERLTACCRARYAAPYDHDSGKIYARTANLVQEQV